MRNVLIFPSFLEDISPGCRILVEKYCATFFLASMVSDEKFVVIQVIFPLEERCHFSSDYFQDFFFLSLVFRSLIYNVSWREFLMFI